MRDQIVSPGALFSYKQNTAPRAVRVDSFSPITARELARLFTMAESLGKHELFAPAALRAAHACGSFRR